MHYQTKQRALLYSFMRDHAHSHFSMRQILDFAQKEGIGTATVYRFLEKLTKSGELSKYAVEGLDGGTCFGRHDETPALYHFVCNDCGKCYHVDCPHMSSMHTHITENHGFEVDLGKTVFRGRCAACIGKELA